MTDQNQSQATDPLQITPDTPCTLQRLFLTWLRIGFTSFGGGAITQYMIQENFIYKYHWLTDEEYANIIAMCQIAPGINLIAYTILIGKRLAGWLGILVSLLGLILPSAAITIGISAIYIRIHQNARVQNSLRTVFAAIFGISLATNWRNIKPIFGSNRKRGSLLFGVTLGIIVGSALLYVLFNPPVVVLYLFGGLCGALAYWQAAKRKKEN
ncbi:MAG TPA: chromate transporter [Firmicutes bacterium]|jgi:chromate transporter|nr:chromate transporter [Bacillota bacterium]